MDKHEQELRQEIKKVIQQAMKESDDLTEAGITGWVIDKISNGMKWAVNRNADYQYDALLKSKEFRSAASHYNMSEKDWDSVARKMIKKDPQRFAKILAYDLRNRKISKFL